MTAQPATGARAPAGVTASGTRLRLRALVAMGHSPQRIAWAIGAAERTIRRIIQRPDASVPESIQLRIAELYEHWWDKVPPERDEAERKQARAARHMARRRHWCTPMGLDDDELDIPGYQPICGWRLALGTGVATDIPPRAQTRNGATSMSEEVHQPASPPRATTYEQAQSGYRSTIDARERFEELANRDLMARAHAALKARGTYDPQRHGDAGKYQPLTAEEHLEILAAGEMLARHYRHPALIHQAVKAGVSWSQIADATGSDEAQARQAYREWADGQHRLHADYQGKLGMDDAEHAAAINRAAEPPAGPEIEQEAGQ